MGSENLSRRRRVLIADNNADLAQVLGEIIRMDDTLELVGCVTTGAEALAQSLTGATDVLVLDLTMGDCHGFEILDRLRAESSMVKVIVHTGHSSEALAAHALRKGATAYVVKDGDTETLLAAIRNS